MSVGTHVVLSYIQRRKSLAAGLKPQAKVASVFLYYSHQFGRRLGAGLDGLI